MKNIQFALLTAICIATAFTFLACEKKEKKEEAEATPAETEQAVPEDAWEALKKAEAECPEKKIGSPTTTEAVFLKVLYDEDTPISTAVFRLNNGEELWLSLAGEITFVRDGTLWFKEKVILETEKSEGDKVSITYQMKQVYYQSSNGPEEAPDSHCEQRLSLESLTVLSKAAKEPIATEENCPDKEGPLQTAEATFLEMGGGIDDLEAFLFRLADGKEIALYSYDDQVKNLVKNLKKDDRASIKYKKKHGYSPTDEKSCWDYDALESVKILLK